MRAAIFRGSRDIVVGERPDPVIQEPTDAIVRVVIGCVCGSDLWYYRGRAPTPPSRSATSYRRSRGDRRRGTTVTRETWWWRRSFTATCRARTARTDRRSPASGRQLRQRHHRRRPGRGRPGPAGRKHPGPGPRRQVPDQTLRSLLTLSDVMATGHHAAVSGGVSRGDVVAVTGDGRSACPPSSRPADSVPTGHRAEPPS